MNNKKICVIGLGYVGLTLSTVLAEVGFNVTGVEKRKEVVDQTNNGISHFSESGIDEALKRVVKEGLLQAQQKLTADEKYDVYIITVGTPLDSNGQARLDMIVDAATEVSNNINDGGLVILRSTVKLGTARNIVAPILEKSGKSYRLSVCPERTLEGNALKELRQLPQIVGADDFESRQCASQLFQELTNTVVQVSSLETAELIKLIDNTFRDVQFGFANEVARMCDAFGLNAYEVITSGKLGYSRTNVPLPGLVGGPCLEKDPHILIESLKQKNVDLKITAAARHVNESQPVETFQFIKSQISKRGFGSKPKIGLLGLAFKGIPSTDDLRGSMSLKILDLVKIEFPESEVRLYDPVIEFKKMSKLFDNFLVKETIAEAICDADVVIIGNNHPDFGRINLLSVLSMMRKDGFIYDYWNHFSSYTAKEHSDSYFAVGNTIGMRG